MLFTGIPPTPISPNCSISDLETNGTIACTVLTRPAGEGAYRVDAVGYTPPSQADQASRFLLQTTFGPTRAEIQDLLSSPLSTTQSNRRISESTLAEMDWILDQIQLPPTYHLAYLRSRVNA